MMQSASVTYVLDFTVRTITAIELASKYCNQAESPAFRVDVTTAEVDSMRSVGLARRHMNQIDGDVFVVELDTGAAELPTASFELPFTLVMLLASQAERALSVGSDDAQL